MHTLASILFPSAAIISLIVIARSLATDRARSELSRIFEGL